MIEEVLDFLDRSPTAFQVVHNISELLDTEGYTELKESQEYVIEKGKGYYIRRNDSSIMIVNVGSKLEKAQLKIVAAHGDCPSFKLKPQSLIKDGNYVKLNTEPYGGALFTPWFDRPLSLAGRLIIKEDGKLKSESFILDEDFCIIPSLAIHQNREANNGFKPNAQSDLLPIITLDQDFDLKKYLESKVQKEVVNYDLYLYPRLKHAIYKEAGLCSAHHLDDLLGATLAFLALIDSFDDEAIDIAVIFDNEEVGSSTYQGADSDFLEVNLERITKALGLDLARVAARSYALSLDSAHAIHPAHPEKADPVNFPKMNDGITIKVNASQSYTTDALSASILTSLLEENDIPYQYFTNRSDTRGGSTLGNIANKHTSIRMADIGIAQLAMHSVYETCGTKDIEYMYLALKHFYNDKLIAWE